MFYNIPSRRRALSKPNEEYAKIIDVVNRYAIHCEGIAFSLKKHGEKAASVLTSQRNTVTDNIRLIYGTNIANELLAFETENAEYRFKARGLVTNANYHVKKMTFLLFINRKHTCCVYSLLMFRTLSRVDDYQAGNRGTLPNVLAQGNSSFRLCFTNFGSSQD